jgi:translation initiation factor IF-2
MVAGVGSIDLALLIVAADDGWMPQTEEHLQILTGVRRAVVALTKIDLAKSDHGSRNFAARIFFHSGDELRVCETDIAQLDLAPDAISQQALQLGAPLC